MLPMKVHGVGFAQMSLMPVVILTDETQERFLPLLIGSAEATAIGLALENVEPPRPFTHDLLAAVIDRLGGIVDRVVITDLVDDTYYAEIVINAGGKVLRLDARPSDSIALALRCKAPIFVADAVAERGLLAQLQEDQEMEDFKRFLENLTPDDFRKNN